MMRRLLFCALFLLVPLDVWAQTQNVARTLVTVDARTIASNGGGTPATLTLTPTADVVAITCNDTDGCTLTMGEPAFLAGTANNLSIVNVSANAVTLADSSGVVELTSAVSLAQWETLSLAYVTDSSRWVERARSSNIAAVETFTNKTYNAESTGNVLTLPFSLWWPAAFANASAAYDAGWTYAASNNPTLTRYDGSNNFAAYLDFGDGGTVNIYREWKLPADWTGALDLVLYWRSTATSGNVVWQIATSCSADAETNDPSWNAAQTITDATKGTTVQLNMASLTSLTTTGCAAGELFHLKVFRDPSHASDTLGATASLVGVEFTYRRAM